MVCVVGVVACVRRVRRCPSRARDGCYGNAVAVGTATFVCNWTLGQCDRMPPQVHLLFHDALDGDATVSFVC